ncbi:MAG: MFS transporter [Streptosporangiales bacterium]|nr:MFS transporter [Streptosporangiales bacterium]MBO0889345.1 MFS transporter [Acidothermales bacterium]
MGDLLRRSDFRLLLLGLCLTMFGDRALVLANGIWVKSLTQSDAAAGLTILLLVAPSMVSPFFGVVVDKVRRRPFLIVLNLSCAAAVVPLFLVHDRKQVWIVYAVSFLYGIGLILNDSAVAGVLKTMLGEQELASANGVIQTLREGMRLVVPLAGAGLFAAFGGHAVVLLDMATLLLGAAVLAVLRLREPSPVPTGHRLRGEMVAGIRHMFRTPELLTLVLTCGAALLVIGFGETIVFAVIDRGLHRAPAFLGVLMSMQGAGAIVGGATAAHVVRRAGELTTAAFGLALFGVGDALMMFAHLPPVLFGCTVAGVGLPWILVALYTLMQRRTPTHLIGRVATTAEVLIGGPQTVSIAIGAALITVVHYQVLLLVMAVVLVGCGLVLGARANAAGRSVRPVTALPPPMVPELSGRYGSSESS